MTKKTFEEWLGELDAILIADIGISYQDLSDCPYSTWYEQKVTPKTAAKRAKKFSA